jgi:uncharacterized protein
VSRQASATMGDYRSEVRDGMRIDWDVPIAMEDGLVLRADVYRPDADGRYPGDPDLRSLRQGARLAGRALQATWWRCSPASTPTCRRLVQQVPELGGVDPEKWVPDGYVCVRVDSRGAGRSPGFIDIWSLREAQDFASASTGPACSRGRTARSASTASPITPRTSGSVRAAAQAPRRDLPWEGAADFYRDMAHHGGIFCTFTKNWYAVAGLAVQHGAARAATAAA